jgi:prophage regulatory protein
VKPHTRTTTPTNTSQSAQPKELLGWEDLRAKGITYSDVHVWRLVKADKFPSAVSLGPGTRKLWRAADIDEWIRDRLQPVVKTEDAA